MTSADLVGSVLFYYYFVITYEACDKKEDIVIKKFNS